MPYKVSAIRKCGIEGSAPLLALEPTTQLITRVPLISCVRKQERVPSAKTSEVVVKPLHTPTFLTYNGPMLVRTLARS